MDGNSRRGWLDRGALRAAVLAAGVLAAGSVANPAPITYGYTGALQSFTATTAGSYVITAHGAQGGDGVSSTVIGGLGAEAQARSS